MGHFFFFFLQFDQNFEQSTIKKNNVWSLKIFGLSSPRCIHHTHWAQFTQDAEAHLHANSLILLSCVNTPIDCSVFHNLLTHCCEVLCVLCEQGLELLRPMFCVFAGKTMASATEDPTACFVNLKPLLKMFSLQLMRTATLKCGVRKLSSCKTICRIFYSHPRVSEARITQNLRNKIFLNTAKKIPMFEQMRASNESAGKQV